MDKLKILQKHFLEGGCGEYIYLNKGNLYATDCFNLGLYKVDNKDTKLFDGKTLEEITEFKVETFPNISLLEEKTFYGKTNEIVIDRKQLLDFLNKIVSMDQYKEEEVIDFEFLIKDQKLFVRKEKVKKEICDLSNSSLYFKNFYEARIIKQYLETCSSEKIKIKYSVEFKTAPLRIEGDIYTLFTMPCKSEEVDRGIRKN